MNVIVAFFVLREGRFRSIFCSPVFSGSHMSRAAGGMNQISRRRRFLVRSQRLVSAALERCVYISVVGRLGAVACSGECMH